MRVRREAKRTPIFFILREEMGVLEGREKI